MVQFSILLGLLATGAPIVSGAPAVAPAPAAAPKLTKKTSCFFSGSSGAAAVAKSKASCATITLSDITVPAGTTLDLTNLNRGTQVVFEGTTSFGYEEWKGPLISVSGTDITVTGAPGNVIEGGGARWWDGEGSDGGKIKPKFFYAHSLTSSSINGLNFKDSPVQLMSIDNAQDLGVTNISMDNGGRYAEEKARNTDAFDVADSTGVTISGANIRNQDDCLAINSGSYIGFTGGTCIGGHGISVGSIGDRSDNTVKDVTVSSSTVKDSENGVRIKTITGATGSVSSVTYKDITLSNIAQYGVVIEQDYENTAPTGEPTNGVPITGLTVDGVKGNVASGGTQVYILCGEGNCSDWKWNGVSLTGGKQSNQCQNVPSGVVC